MLRVTLNLRLNLSSGFVFETGASGFSQHCTPDSERDCEFWSCPLSDDYAVRSS